MHAEQKSNGKWLARYNGKDGKRRSAGVFSTKEEALEAAARAEGDHLTLSEYFEQWKTEPHVQLRTRIDYEQVFRNHIEPYLGGSDIDEITSRDVRAMLKPHLESKKLAMAAKVKAVTGSLFKALIESGRVDNNPAHGVTVPTAHADPFRAITVDEFGKVCLELPEVAELFAKFLVGTGLRFGEATEIRVKDIQGDEIIVRRRASRVGLKRSSERIVVEDATKSGRKRVVPLSEKLSTQVQAHIQGMKPEDLVFDKKFFTGVEGHLSPEAWRKIWIKAVKRSRIGWIPRTHDLRHAHATILVASGIDIFEVKERMGHQSIETTQIYLHRQRAQMSKAAAAADVFL